jgi:diacylglycerol kinase (ATP)
MTAILQTKLILPPQCSYVQISIIGGRMGLNMDETRHVFVVNPVAGKSGNEKRIKEMVQAYFSHSDKQYDIRITKAAGHALEIVREEAARGGQVRIYACGGDGTLNEVANGAVGQSNVQLAVVPLGSGNDYIKIFGTRQDFLDLPALINGREISVDLIKVSNKYAINVCSVGFDSEVALNMSRFKRLPLVTGKLAYDLAIIYCLLNKMKRHFDIIIDGEKHIEGEFLLCVAACGRFYGGSFLAAPAALPNDGVLDFVLADSVGRIDFIKMVNKYREGKHEGISAIHHYTGKRLEISSTVPFAMNLDGECSYLSKAEFEIVPSAIRFILPSVLEANFINIINKTK